MNRSTAIIVALSIALVTMMAVMYFGGGSRQRNGAGEAAAPVLADSASVTGEVGVPAGVDAFGIVVFAEGTSYMALTDAEGKFTVSGLKKGEYKFRAARVDLVSEELESVKVTDADLAKPQPFKTLLQVLMELKDQGGDSSRLSLASLGSIRGRVRTNAGGDESGTTVLLEGSRHRTVTLAGGEYEIINIEPGNYNLVFFRSGYNQNKVPITITAGQELAVQDVELVARADSVDGDRTVVGRVEVLTSDGSVVSDYSNVRVILEGTSFLATPDSTGRFELRNLPPRTLTISASAPGYILEKKFELNLQNLAATEVELVLIQDTLDQTGKGTVLGRVFLSDGAQGQHAGIAVSLAGTSQVAFTNANGEYTLQNVATGTQDIVATFNGYKSGYIEGLQVTAPGETMAPDLTLEADIIAPYVVSTDPTDGQSRVSIQHPTTATIQFSMNMDSASVISAISIKPDVGFRVSSGGGRDIFKVDLDAVPGGRGIPLKYGTKYTVTVAETAASIEGVPMAEAYSFAFTTGHAEIISTDPANGEKGRSVNFDIPIAVHFNAPIDRESITSDDIRFDPQLGSSANINFKNDPATGWTTMFISGFAQPDKEYLVTIGRGAKTITGDRVRNLPYKFRFTTARWRDASEIYGTGEPDRDQRRRERDRRR